jgi:ribosome-binding factor A
VSSHRPERVAELIRHILARLLQEEVRDPRIRSLTLTEVRVSSDLKHARAYVSMASLAGEKEKEVALGALNRAASFLRRSLAREAGLRHTPDIRFLEDRAVERGQRVDELLEAIHKNDTDTCGP